MSYQQFFQECVDQLHVHPNGRQAYGRCPMHEDHVKSFSVNLLTSQWFCHAKCGSGNALTLARRLGLRPPDENGAVAPPYSPSLSKPAVTMNTAPAAERDRGAATPPAKISATYEYQYEDGSPAHRTLRYEPKSFRQQGWKDGQWIWSMEGIRRVPYRLPQLLKATGTVYLVEGEKDVESLEAISLVATTTPMGANSWQPEYAAYFKRKYVAIIPDNDDPGRAYADRATRDIIAAGGFAKLVHLPNLQPKQDVSDFLSLPAGGRDALLSCVRNTPPFGHVRISDEDPVAYLNRHGIFANDGAGYLPNEFKKICEENYRQFAAAAKNCTDAVMSRLDEIGQIWKTCRTKGQYQRFLRLLKEAHEMSMADVA